MSEKNDNKSNLVLSGLSMGGSLAMICSHYVNESVLWAILHGFCSWLYVLYYVLVY